MHRLFEALHNFVATWADFAFWRDDWNRTWSPASYFLAAAVLVAFAALIYLYGRDVLALLG